MTEITGKRITFKRSRPNPLFESWLEELHEEASNKKSKLEPMLKEALTSLSKYPLPLLTGAECAILSGFDKRLCQFLDSRLEVYNSNNLKIPKPASPIQVNASQDSSSNNSNLQQTNGVQNGNSNQNMLNINEATASTSQISSHLSSCNTSSPQTPKPPEHSAGKRARKTKHYKPAHRSGGYAILLGLLENSESGNPVNKENLIEIAQKYCEESFVRPKPESLYTAWSSMSKLVTKGLVVKHGARKATYTLSEQGLNLAKELLEESKNIPTINNIIFNDNHVKNQEPILTINNGHQNHIDIVDNEIPTTSEQCLVDKSPILEMLPGTFDVVLIIDIHETNGLSKKTDPTVAQFNKYPDLKHEYRSLKVGDFTWIARDKVNSSKEFILPYIVERKRMDDLGASIKDGRFHEQKFRLKKSGLKNIIYLVENYGSNKHIGLPVQTLMQALANTRVQNGFKVHITDSLTNSARFLAMMTKRLTIEYKDKTLKGHNQEPSGDILPTFAFFNKAALKNKPLSVTDTFIKLLLQMKGVSVEKALAITKVYKTPSSLFKAYEGCDDDREGELLLANLKYKNVSSNVGPKVSKSIYQLFTFDNYI
ncbi:crossover junction endonuclease MUS81 [Aricia agestis]|uniref:crossover junction endonuclease MUS81 n=1 Tax=Aricia agestis TaxID=91739 RepID=UPI001C203585|nr:crossover junction endonuclease MUS81 [Aricia agestis]